MKDQKIKDVVVNIKNYVVEMPKKRKQIVGIVLGAIVVAAIALTAVLQYNAAQYKVLYSGLEQTEVTAIYQKLVEEGVAVQLNSSGELVVPANQYDALLLKLAGEGYPQSAMTYDLFSSHAGLTTTESQSKQWRIYQLQERVQGTLKRMDGVVDATVTINIPDTSDYVWNKTEEKESATASILLTLRTGTTLSTSQVDAIKNLVASGCPNMKPEDVKVVDAKTSLELSGSGNTGDNQYGLSNDQSMELEAIAQQRIEENIRRLLVTKYGENGVVAAAKVTLNLGKTITESKQLQEKPDGGGFENHTEGSYSLAGEQTMGDIVGEENNTDIPNYPYANPAGEEGLTNFSWSTDFDYSYVKTQVEKGNYSIDRATISVMVNEPNLTQALRTELVNLISNGADIPTAQISVSSFASETPIEEDPGLVEDPTGILAVIQGLPWWAYLAAGAGLVFLIALLFMLIAMRRKAKKEAAIERKRLEEEAVRKVGEEIAEYKKQLADSAKGGSTEVDEAIMKEVKDFAKQNPEVTANLLRSWLRE